MKQLIKRCKKHGDLKPEDIIKREDSRYRIGYSLRCQLCKNEQTWRYQSKNCRVHGKIEGDDITSQNKCRWCVNDWARKWKKENREHINTKYAEDRKNNPEKWKARYQREYQFALSNQSNRAVKEILRMRNLTQEQYDKMFEDQDHKCKICLQPETRKGRTPGTIAKLCVDHCHSTNIVRGLLCYKCNSLLGFARDSVEVLEMAIMYLQEYEQKGDYE